MVCENIFTAPPRHNGWKWCFQSKNRLDCNFLTDSKFQRTSKSHYWFKSYGNFAEKKCFFLLHTVVKLAVEGLLSTGPTPSSFTVNLSKIYWKKLNILENQWELADFTGCQKKMCFPSFSPIYTIFEVASRKICPHSEISY